MSDPVDAHGCALLERAEVPSDNPDQRATDPPAVLTVDELGRLLRIVRETAYALIAQGELPDMQRWPLDQDFSPGGAGLAGFGPRPRFAFAEDEMSVRRRKWRDPKTGALKDCWMIDVVEHTDGRRERIRKVAPIQNMRAAEYERDMRIELLKGPTSR